MYTKPENVGKKPNETSRKRHNGESLIVEDRFDDVASSSSVSPFVIKKKKGGDYACQKKDPAVDLNRLNPKREAHKVMTLRLKSKHKAVSR